MSIGRAWRVGGFVTALAASVGLVAAATSATGAYFSDTQNGSVAGTFGSVKVVTTGHGGGSTGGSLAFDFANLMPGTPQTATVTYKNTGTAKEDIYLVFPNVQALHALNNRGRYGYAQVTSNGQLVFQSSNLTDGYAANPTSTEALSTWTAQGPSHCPTDPPTPAVSAETLANAVAGTSPCWPLPNVIKLASNLGVNASGTMTFSFAPTGKERAAGDELQPAFCYPLKQDPHSSSTADQVCATGAAHVGYDLPYQIVATQPGIAPDNKFNTTPTP